MGFWYNDRKDKFRVGRISLVITLSITIIVGSILGGLSFKQVGVNAYGLKRNLITNEVDPTVYSSGLHFVGFWNEFIVFPSTWTTVEFTPADTANDIPISVQTKNGLLVSIDTSFQFRLRKSDLYQLFSEYGTEYLSYVEAVARSALREIVGDYNAETLYANRSVVNAAMQTSLLTALSTIVEVGDFQLRTIDFPDSFQAAVEQYEVWRIEVEIAQLEQQAEVIKQQTLTLVAEYTANRTIIEYEGIATALEAMRDELNMTTEDLLTYLWIQTIREHDQAYLFIGLQDIPILVPVNGTI